MKSIRQIKVPEVRTVVLLTGIAIGVGIVLHEVFFLVALLIALSWLFEWGLEATHERTAHGNLAHRHL